jgi:hypothetical protein
MMRWGCPQIIAPHEFPLRKSVAYYHSRFPSGVKENGLAHSLERGYHTVARQLELQYAGIVHSLTIVDFHIIPFLNRLHQVPVVVSHKSSSCFVIENKHELIHIHDLALDVDVPHPVADLIYSRFHFTLNGLAVALYLNVSLVSKRSALHRRQQRFLASLHRKTRVWETAYLMPAM